ncbi:hypothetical protein EYF80_033806 [Liparis tanakae]|uniref:Uncharacterized protein n=1 Tax=Liparis tanakae TaxID=230148 RepID=A0A4Z2GRN9_9TELE|nr:hypothetical protein EYF80_033806 [Liparis tanakae]
MDCFPFTSATIGTGAFTKAEQHGSPQEKEKRKEELSKPQLVAGSGSSRDADRSVRRLARTPTRFSKPDKYGSSCEMQFRDSRLILVTLGESRSHSLLTDFVPSYVSYASAPYSTA